MKLKPVLSANCDSAGTMTAFWGTNRFIPHVSLTGTFVTMAAMTRRVRRNILHSLRPDSYRDHAIISYKRKTRLQILPGL